MLHDSVLASHVGSILIVEDNQTNALILRSMLGKNGYSSLVASDGREGVDAHRVPPFRAARAWRISPNVISTGIIPLSGARSGSGPRFCGKSIVSAARTAP